MKLLSYFRVYGPTDPRLQEIRERNAMPAYSCRMMVQPMMQLTSIDLFESLGIPADSELYESLDTLRRTAMNQMMLATRQNFTTDDSPTSLLHVPAEKLPDQIPVTQERLDILQSGEGRRDALLRHAEAIHRKLFDCKKFKNKFPDDNKRIEEIEKFVASLNLVKPKLP